MAAVARLESNIAWWLRLWSQASRVPILEIVCPQAAYRALLCLSFVLCENGNFRRMWRLSKSIHVTCFAGRGSTDVVVGGVSVQVALFLLFLRVPWL